MGNLVQKDNSPKEPAWKQHPPFPDKYESFQVVRELKGSSKPQKVSCKQGKSQTFDYFVSKASKYEEQTLVEYAVNKAYRAAGIMVCRFTLEDILINCF